MPSTALPTAFRSVVIGGVPFWDGGYLGNPALAPLLGQAQDLLLVVVNAFHPDVMPRHTAPAILDRLNEITFNASVALELNAIEATNRLLADLVSAGVPYAGRYRPIRIHAIRDDALAASLIPRGRAVYHPRTGIVDAATAGAIRWLSRCLRPSRRC
jgi:NTE family protein